MMIRKVSGQSLCSPCILKIPFRVAGYPETNELLPDNPFRTTAQLVSRPAIIVSFPRSIPRSCPVTWAFASTPAAIPMLRLGRRS